MFIYGNWSAYDELSDGVILIEELALTQMAHLRRLQEQGVHFDAYLMDAFWYDPAHAYRIWRKSTWPQGPDRWFDACRDNNLLPGLWFTANTLFHMDLSPHWEDSIDSKGWGLCCFQGGFLPSFMDTLHYWYEQGVRLFKLDFAEFAAAPKGLEDRWSPQEARAKNIAAYRNALSKFLKDHPEAHLLGFNGFDHKECMDRSDNPPGDYICPDWLDEFSSLYCGDPRPADLPGDFWRSVDFYADCMTRLYESSGIPLSKIDNCGFMAGPTGTCYWRGKANWQESLLLSFARGGKFHLAYGDLSQFSDKDACWWAAAQNLFRTNFEGSETSSFGGWPGNAEPFGWLNCGETTVATVVNPGLATKPISLPPGSWHLVTTNQSTAPSMLENSVDLWPGGIAIYSSAETTLDLRKISEPPSTELALQMASGTGPTLEVNTPSLTGILAVIVTQTDVEGRALRTYPGEPDSFPIRLSIRDAQGIRELPAMVDRKIWSGISWSRTLLHCVELTEIKVITSEVRPCVLNLRIFV